MVLDRVGVRRRVDLHVGCAAAVKFCEQWFEPVLLLVINRYGLVVVARSSYSAATRDRRFIPSTSTSETAGRWNVNA